MAVDDTTGAIRRLLVENLADCCFVALSQQGVVENEEALYEGLIDLMETLLRRGVVRL